MEFILEARLDRFARGNDVVLLGDFNTHFAEALDDLVGDLVFPSRHTVPPALQSLLSAPGSVGPVHLFLLPPGALCHLVATSGWARGAP